MSSVRNLLTKLNISRILFIDDQLYISEDEKIQKSLLFIEKHKENKEIRDIFLKELDEDDVISLFDYGEDAILLDDDKEEKRNITLNIINNLNADLFCGPAKQIENKLNEFFPNIVIDTATRPEEKNFSEYDLIFMDYDYKDEHLTALDKLKDLNLKNDALTYIVFLSSHYDFEFNNISYSMIESGSRQDLFRKYSSTNFLEFKALLNYICKDSTHTKESFFADLYEILKEFESGELMFSSLTSIQGLLEKGVNDAIKKLLLTSSKTMKALITEKLEIEGVSETTYLVDFTLAIAKNLLGNKVSEMEEIHGNLMNIQGWSCEIWDFETDKHMRELRRIEVFDENINNRYTPIDFGDIFVFQIENKPVRGLLISQSCDMAVREIGDRKIGRNTDIATVILETHEKNGGNCIPIKLGTEEIIFDIRTKLLVPTFLLDFSSINIDGNACFVMNQATDRKFTWGNYFYKYMVELITKKSKEFSELPNGQHSKWVNGTAYTFEKTNNNINFKVKRTGRLDYLHTLSVLKSKTNNETRIPLSLDLSEKEFIQLTTKLNGKETKLQFYYYEKKKNVIASVEDLLKIIELEGYEIPVENIEEIKNTLSELSLEHFILSEQFSGKKMLIINDENTKFLREKGINIQSSKKHFSIDVMCKFHKEAKIEQEV